MVKHGEIRNLVIYKKKSVVVEKEKTDCFLHSTSYRWRKRLLKAKLLLLKELLIHENKPKTKQVRSCRRHRMVGNSQ